MNGIMRKFPLTLKDCLKKSKKYDFFALKAIFVFFIAAFSFFGCTMPLPGNSNNEVNSLLPNNSTGIPNSSSFQSLFIPLQDIGVRLGLHNGSSLFYLDLNACGADPRCTNQLALPLNLLVAYQFFNSDNTPVLGQLPVFNLPAAGEKNSPFRQIWRVIVPAGYVANTIRSAEDLAASQFRIESTGRAFNFPLVTTANAASVNLNIKKAWQKAAEIRYLDLGGVPYSASNNQLGVGLIYFLRNRDSSDLPSNPAPILDTVPGDLLYSPIRQVFRAISENQIESQEGDPARGIRSQEDLLKAVNQGLFRLEDTGSFFNYPVFQDGNIIAPPDTEVYGLYLAVLKTLPSLPNTAHYALWSRNQEQENRLLLRFRSGGFGLFDLQNQPQDISKPLFRFSESELASLNTFFVTVENEEESSPSQSIILQSDANSGGLKRTLSLPFQNNYTRLQTGNFLLATPTDSIANNGEFGLWFARRTTADTSQPPLSQALEPGLVLSLPPVGWLYQGWVLYRRNPELWLPLGRFSSVNQADQENPFSGLQKGYDFPGEDFFKSPPSGVTFPFNLPSSGDSEVVLALQPQNVLVQAPFFPLFRAALTKATPVYANLNLPPVAFSEPEIQVELRPEAISQP